MTTLSGLEYTLPCRVCRQGFALIKEELPLTDECFAGSFNLAQWLYQVKDKVNQKLLRQDKLLGRYGLTRPSPPFACVVQRYLAAGMAHAEEPGTALP